jgi:hypothetical protein
MDKELYQELVNIISGYYPITNNGSNQISEIVTDKINHLENPSDFKSLCKDFETIGHVEDFSYMQFPNKKFYLEEITDTGIYRTYKNFAVCISLLCPYYTFFYEFQFKVKTTEGFLGLSQICFLNDKKFDLIRRELDLKKIDSMIKARFPHYSYVDHYALLVNEVEKGLPFGEFETEKKQFSIFRYLFDNITFDKYFP